jgi:hypothetical protein
VRTGKATEIAVIVTMLGTVAINFVTGGYDTLLGSAFLLLVVLASLPHNRRRGEQIRRRKEILNRYSSERNSRPLGL